MLLQNLLIEMIAGILGIGAGCIVAILAEEELEQYKPILQKSVKGAFLITFLVPLFFIEMKLFPIILALSYGILALIYKQEEKFYYLLVPLVLFITAQQEKAVHVTLLVFFLALMLATISLLISFVRKKELHWSKEAIRTLAQTFWIFFVISSFLYGIVWIV